VTVLRIPSALLATLAALAAFTSPALARESLGLYGGWGAFRDPLIPRCYAIAMAEPSAMQRDYQPYAAIGTWPKRGTRSQVHLRLSRRLALNAPVTLRVGSHRIVMTAGGGDAWPRSDIDNAAIVAAMRSAPSMTVNARDAKGRPFANTWTLPGAASAMDAALIGCARLR
jgi:hypothetical protein